MEEGLIEQRSVSIRGFHFPVVETVGMEDPLKITRQIIEAANEERERTGRSKVAVVVPPEVGKELSEDEAARGILEGNKVFIFSQVPNDKNESPKFQLGIAPLIPVILKVE